MALAPRLAEKGVSVKGVRLDSGDLAAHARKVRRIVDEGGLGGVKILASGNLDEYALQALVQQNAPIDSFALGTKVATSADFPYLDCAYKLQEYGGRPCRKRSEGKATWPGRKQVYRRYDGEGRIAEDTVTVIEDCPEGVPLLQPVMRQGRRVAEGMPLASIRATAARELACLPTALQQIEEGKSVPVTISDKLEALADSVDRGL